MLNKKNLLILVFINLNFFNLLLSKNNSDLLDFSKPYKVLGIPNNATTHEAELAKNQLQQNLNTENPADIAEFTNIETAYQDIRAFNEKLDLAMQLSQSAYLPKCFLIDSVQLVNEIYRIKTLGSKHFSSLKTASFFSKIENIFELCILPINAFSQWLLSDLEKETNYFYIGAKCTSLLSSLAAINFYKHNDFVNKNANKIATNNINSKYNFNREKKIYLMWLFFNKIFPYLGYILSRITHDEVPISQIFDTTDIANSDGKSNNIMMVLRTFSKISEIMRKKQLYKTEMKNF